MLAKFPEPDGTGGESILGLPGKPDFSEWQIVLLESQGGFAAGRTDTKTPPLPPSLPLPTAQPRRPGNCCSPRAMEFRGLSTSSICFHLTSALIAF